MSDPHEKRFFPDGRKILHSKTILRRRKNFNTALDSELSLLGNASHDAMDTETLESTYADEEDKVSVVHQSMDVEGERHGTCSPYSPVEECQPPSSFSENIKIGTDKADKMLKTRCCISDKGCNLVFLQDFCSSTVSKSFDSSDSETESRGLCDVPRESIRAVHPESATSTTPTANTSEHNIAQETDDLTDTLSTHLLDNTSKEDSESFHMQPLQDYILGSADFIMFKESGLKIWEVIMVILGISTRFGLSYKARRALIEATKLFAGPLFSSWDISDYYLLQIFNPPNDVIRYHFYCEVCCKELEESSTKKKFKNHKIVCKKCLCDYSLTMGSPNRFLSIDIKYQLSSLLKMRNVKGGLFENLKNVNSQVHTDGSSHHDVYSSKLYRKIVKNGKKGYIILTYNFATDGVPINNNSIDGFWPILLFINELPPRLRFQYTILAGLWVAKKEPSPELMNMYMKPFVEQATNLGNGFFLNIDGKCAGFVLQALACCVDTVARPILQNRVQYNGKYGCSWCLCEGQYKFGCVRFLMEEEEPLNRSHEAHLIDMQSIIKHKEAYVKQKASKVAAVEELREHEDTDNEAEKESPAESHVESIAKTVEEAARSSANMQIRRKQKKLKKINSINGIKGYSVLTGLDGFDLVWSFSRDYLHADLIGITPQLWNLWNNIHIYLTKQQQIQVNTRLMTMTPPQEIHRLVRPLATEQCKWKASEWRSWLLYYAIPCLIGILDEYALQHFALLVKSIRTLLQSSVSEVELKQAEHDLLQFVCVYEMLYGEQNITFNVHSAKHIVECIRHTGLPWATSTFPSENAIFYLKHCVHGPKGIYDQMSNKTIQGNVFQSLVEEVINNPSIYKFCKSLFSRHEVFTFCRTGDIVMIGKGIPHPDYTIPSEGHHQVLLYDRCISSSMVIHSKEYSKPTKSNDTVFRLKNQKFAQVLMLMMCNGTAYAEVQCFNVSNIVLSCKERHSYQHLPSMEDVVLNDLFKVDKNEGKISIPVIELQEKCVLMSLENNMYVSTMPNTHEIQ